MTGFIIFVASMWLIFTLVFLRPKTRSIAKSAGAGLATVVITVAVIGGLLMAQEYLNGGGHMAGSVATLADAGFQGRAWRPDELPRARLTTYRQLSSLGQALADADRKGNISLVMQVMPEATAVMAAWNDQTDSTRATGRDCVLAAMHLLAALDPVAARVGWPRRDQFEAALSDCKP
jgi:hypothetical protein